MYRQEAGLSATMVPLHNSGNECYAGEIRYDPFHEQWDIKVPTWSDANHIYKIYILKFCMFNIKLKKWNM